MYALSRFFIDRPILAWVIGIMTMLIGAVALFKIPVSQYPLVASPSVSVSAGDPGASAETLNNTVVQPLLQEMFGLDHLEYASSSSSYGSMRISLTFEQGTNPDIAQMQVQNRLQTVQSQLPQEVSTQGISVLKEQSSYMMILAFYSENNSMSDTDISDYLASQVNDTLARVNGVGGSEVFGSEYAMRIWIDPAKLYYFKLNISDIKNALRQQNIQIPAGELGGLPAKKDAKIDATIIGPRRFTKIEDFQKILLRVNRDNSRITLGDVAKLELGPQSFNFFTTLNNHSSSGIGVKLAPGGNQLEVEDAVLKKLKELSVNFPPHLVYALPFDSKPYITHSIEDVFETLIVAIFLVFTVMMIFLQDLRATIIPTLTVPFVILGTFGLLFAFGYTLNTLTMLALVLAIGLLVDDAIVVVENVKRLMIEENLSPKKATHKSMQEISGALFGIVMVLTAVFLPMAFFSGSVGIIYRQFSITIVVAMWLSLGAALILTPAMCATILTPYVGNTGSPKIQGKGIFGKIMRGFSEAAHYFNVYFDKMTQKYLKGILLVLRNWKISLAAFLLLSAVAAVLFLSLSSSFFPDEDQALIIGQVRILPNETQAKLRQLGQEVSAWILKTYPNEIRHIFFIGQGQNNGSFYIDMASWEKRTKSNQSAEAVAGKIMEHFWLDPRAKIFTFSPPAVPELGEASGFDLELLNEAGLNRQDFLSKREDLLKMAAQDPLLSSVRANGLDDVAQYVLEVDRGKANAMGISNNDINDTISGALGSIYVNQFLRNNRVKQVYIQAAPSARMTENDLKRWYIRNKSGEMVPLNAFTSGHWITGPQKLETYNGRPSFEISGMPAAGVSSGQAMKEMERLVRETPGGGLGYAWTGLSFEQLAAGKSTLMLYLTALIIIFLCLAGLYESWVIPVSVLLVLPLGILGAVFFTACRGYANDIYFQIGMLTTVALSVKNAILIIEFAYEYYNKGILLIPSAIKASKQRLRPILMTSIAFLCGVIPLAVATGAGAGARRAIGTCVVGGMVSATVFTVYFVPLFFITVLHVLKVRPALEKR